MANKYAFENYKNEIMAKASGRGLPISFKQSIEICSFLRKRKVSDAKTILERVIKQEQAIPFKRFNSDVGHRPGKLAAGRYPIKASQEILDLLNSVEANAQFKGLNTANLVITHIIANKSTTTRRFGRQRSRSAKRTNIELVVEEKAEKKEAKQDKPAAKKEESKVAEKKSEVKAESKPAAPKAEQKPAEKKAEVKKEVPAKVPEKKEQPKAAPKQEAKSESKPKEEKKEAPKKAEEKGEKTQ